jgi:hypothetical protein
MSGVFDRPLRAHVVGVEGHETIPGDPMALGVPCLLLSVDVTAGRVVIAMPGGEIETRTLDNVRVDYRYSEEDHEFHDLLEFGPDGKLLPPPGMKDEGDEFPGVDDSV